MQEASGSNMSSLVRDNHVWCVFYNAKDNRWIKGLRPVLEAFVVTMHEGACETGSQIPRALARGI